MNGPHRFHDNRIHVHPQRGPDPVRAEPSSRSANTPESIESLSRRNEAAEILRSYEKLSWYSFQRGESLVQTRIHFRNIVAGLAREHEMTHVAWEEDFTPRPTENFDDARRARKAKARRSLGEGRMDTDMESESERTHDGHGAASGVKQEDGMDVD